MSKMWPARGFAMLAAAFWVIFFFGYVDLLVPILRQPGFDSSYLLETGWGAMFVFLVGAPVVSAAFAPERMAPQIEVALVGFAVGTIAVVVPEWRQLLPAAGLLLTSFVLALLSGHTGIGLRPRAAMTAVGSGALNRVTLLLTVAASIPLTLYAADMVAGRREGRPPTDDITIGLDHWPMQAALAVAIVLTTGLASTNISGWPVPSWTSAVTVMWMGGFSVGYPTHAGSFGTVGGWAAIGWACALAATTVLRHRSPEHASGSS
ncbi:hypothetical protein LL946_10840 [Knoellia locipacati]|uniref:hypothetical protein n=1 Tax=Knoellia locipacati TaxID=882824 RepID=UPI00384C3843